MEMDRRGPRESISHGMAGRYAESLGTPSCSTLGVLYISRSATKSKSKSKKCVFSWGGGGLGYLNNI